MKKLGELIECFIKEHFISGNAFAKKCKVSQSYISDIINEKVKKPTPEILKKIAPALGVDYKYLLTITGDLEPGSPTPIPAQGIELSKTDLIRIPLLGHCPASPKQWVPGEIEDWYPISKKDARGRRLYFLKVKGDSMNKAGIEDGDTVLVDADKHPINGNVAVIKIDGECTMKRFFKNEKGITLVPDSTNSKHQIATFGPDEDIKIRGVVEAVYMKKIR